MINLLIVFYFSFGLGFYVSACLKNYKSFHHSTPDAIVRGLALGFLLWPFAILTWKMWRDK